MKGPTWNAAPVRGDSQKGGSQLLLQPLSSHLSKSRASLWKGEPSLWAAPTPRSLVILGGTLEGSFLPPVPQLDNQGTCLTLDKLSNRQRGALGCVSKHCCPARRLVLVSNPPSSQWKDVLYRMCVMLGSCDFDLMWLWRLWTSIIKRVPAYCKVLVLPTTQ